MGILSVESGVFPGHFKDLCILWFHDLTACLFWHTLLSTHCICCSIDVGHHTEAIQVVFWACSSLVSMINVQTTYFVKIMLKAALMALWCMGVQIVSLAVKATKNWLGTMDQMSSMPGMSPWCIMHTKCFLALVWSLTVDKAPQTVWDWSMHLSENYCCGKYKLWMQSSLGTTEYNYI